MSIRYVKCDRLKYFIYKKRRDTGKKGSMKEGYIKGEMLDKRIQDSWEVRKVGCRTGGMQEWRYAGL